MKKAIKFVLLIGISSILLCACGDEEEDGVLFTDNGVTIVDPNAEVDKEIAEEQSNHVQEDSYELIDKQAYDELIASLPKQQNGALDRANFTQQQAEMYDKFENGVYRTNFKPEEVQADMMSFFSDENIEKIQNYTYDECYRKTVGDWRTDNDNYKEYEFSASTIDNNKIKVVDGKAVLRIKKDKVDLEYDYIVNYDEDYSFGIRKSPGTNMYRVDEIGSHKPIIEIAKLFNTPNSYTNFQIASIDGELYNCTMDIAGQVYDETGLGDYDFVEGIFKKPETSEEVKARVVVSYTTNTITSISFEQVTTKNEKYHLSYELTGFNDDKNEKAIEESYLSYDDAIAYRDFLDAKLEQKSTESDKYKLEKAPDGTTALLGDNGVPVKDTEGNTIYIYSDTLLPYDPTQIPEGSDTPIGETYGITEDTSALTNDFLFPVAPTEEGTEATVQE